MLPEGILSCSCYFLTNFLSMYFQKAFRWTKLINKAIDSDTKDFVFHFYISNVDINIL